MQTSAYVIFYEMTRASKDAMLTPSPKPVAVPQDSRRVIGPSLPPSPAPPPKLVVSSPQPSPLLPKNRPAVISEPPKVKPAPLVRPKASQPPTEAPKLVAGGLVPYGSDSDSDSEPPPLKPLQALKPALAASPFLPRSVAVNFKKMQEKVVKEVQTKEKEVLVKQSKETNEVQSTIKPESKPDTNEEQPAQANRDPSSEALFSCSSTPAPGSCLLLETAKTTECKNSIKVSSSCSCHSCPSGDGP